MPNTPLSLATPALAALLLATPSWAQEGKARSLDELLKQFDTRAPEAEGGVRLDAWIETGDAGKELVVSVAPEGETKLVADPGITVTPAARLGVEWLSPLPHRLVDPGREYFDPPATIRLPFAADDGQPLELLVEYAWCVVDYQCFFGEETLTVATAAP